MMIQESNTTVICHGIMKITYVVAITHATDNGEVNAV